MSNPIANIRAAFVTKLQSFPSLPSVAWENVAFTPATGVPYLAPYLLPGEPFQAEIGTAGINRHSGIYQISVFVPTGGGVAALNTLTGAMCDHFKRGTMLTYGGITVTVQKAYSAPTMQETDWVHIPVTIQFICNAQN
jgi:hypothetical protein